MTAAIRLLRPKDWVKNLFVFLPLFFSGNLTDTASLCECLVAFASFCMAASAIYCLNDIRDVEADRAHPVKCRRPVASGEVSVGTAWILMAACIAGSILILWLLPEPRRWQSMAIVAGYLAMNVAYSMKLKQIALVDVTIVALGFVLRVILGGVAISVTLSPWIVLMTFLLALFLALCKRRDDILIYNATGQKMRANITRYNLEFLNQASTVTVTTTLICYILYTVSPEVVERFGSDYVYVTSVFVILGILRYIQLTVVDKNSGSPVKIALRDIFTQICIACWIATFFIIIYL